MEGKGESGGGKTTLLHLLIRFYPLEQGNIFFNNLPVADISIPRWREITGVVPQEISIFNGTAAENICLSASPADLRACQQFCVDHGFDRYFSVFPQRYDTPLGEEGITISGGQKQLIAVARALYRRPQLLLLDEPTAAMDPLMEEFVIQLIGKLKSEMTIFIVTHRARLADFADRVYHLQNGTVSQRERVCQ